MTFPLLPFILKRKTSQTRQDLRRRKQLTLGPLSWQLSLETGGPTWVMFRDFSASACCHILLPATLAAFQFCMSSQLQQNVSIKQCFWQDGTVTGNPMLRQVPPELFIRGTHLLFTLCYAVGLCCIFKFTFLPVSSKGAQVC